MRPMPCPRLEWSGYRVLAGCFAAPALHGLIIFASAGRTDLPWIWTYLVVSFIGMFGGIVPVCIRNPDLVNRRGSLSKNANSRSKWLVLTYGIFNCYLTPVVIGLDAGRRHWTHLSAATAVAGVVGYLAGSALLTWAMLVNSQFETTGCIQSDRVHKVVTTGPYRFVRHPGCVGAILWSITTPMITRSGAAFIPALAGVALLVIRTMFKDRTLRSGLPGYTGYAVKTKYRLLPGVW